MNGLGNQIVAFFKGKTLLSSIIAINIAVWLFSALFGLVDYLFELGSGATNSVWYDWFALPSDLGDVVAKPWTLVTYMFIHSGFGHLFFNMLMLYCGGIMCCRYMGMKRFGWTYFLSGAAGALFYLLCYNVFPVFRGVHAYAVGASAGVLGVFVAVATYIPDQEVGIWPVADRMKLKMKWLALAFVAIDLMCIPKGNAGGHIAHIGGMLYGFLSVWLPRQQVFASQKGRRSAKRGEAKRAERRRKKMKATKKTRNAAPNGGRPVSDEDYNLKKAEEQKRVDAILDKISKSGYDSLSKEEKAILFNYR